MNFANFLRTPFYRTPQNDCFCFQLFRSSHRRCSKKKSVLENFRKFTGKHLWFAKFSKTPFLQNTSGRLLLAFSCNVTNNGILPTGVWKTSDEYSLSRNTNLRNTVQVYYFFCSRINFQCMTLLVCTVYCQKQASE